MARAEAVFGKLVEIAASHQIEVTFVNLDPNHEQSYLGRLDPRARYLDLGPLLAAESKRRSIGFKYDAHFNPEANALIGGWLAEFVRRPEHRDCDPSAGSPVTRIGDVGTLRQMP